MNRALLAGGIYALALFALGFLLGTVRVLLIMPMAGELAATLIELPLMLAAGFFTCRWIVRRWKVPAQSIVRLLMGLAFLLLLLALEMLLGLTLIGRSWAEQVSALRSTAGLAGLAAQIVSATFPLLVGAARS
jgi:hypothetical protein